MKVLTGLMAALAIALTGLVAAPAANAAKPYPHTINTTCHAGATANPISKGERPEFAFRITTQGNAVPKARVEISATRNATGATVLRATRHYEGGTEKWTFRHLRKGRFTFHFNTATGPRSVFENCSDDARLHVTR